MPAAAFSFSIPVTPVSGLLVFLAIVAYVIVRDGPDWWDRWRNVRRRKN